MTSKWFRYCTGCNYHYDECVRCHCKTPENVKVYQNIKSKGDQGQRKGRGAGAAASPFASAAHEAPQVFRDAAMRNAAAKIRSDKHSRPPLLPSPGRRPSMEKNLLKATFPCPCRGTPRKMPVHKLGNNSSTTNGLRPLVPATVQVPLPSLFRPKVKHVQSTMFFLNQTNKKISMSS